MNNMLGEPYVRTEINVVPCKGKPLAWINRGDKAIGTVCTNGWNGKSALCEWDVDEPLVTFFKDNFSISIKELELIISAFKAHLESLKKKD